MSAEANKTFIRHAFAALNDGNIDALVACFAPDYVNHSVGTGISPGLADRRDSFAHLRAAFPDLQITLEEVVADGDLVATLEKWQGTRRGEFRGLAASDRAFAFTRMHFFRIRGGLIVDEWAEGDIRQKLSLAPSPE